MSRPVLLAAALAALVASPADGRVVASSLDGRFAPPAEARDSSSPASSARAGGLQVVRGRSTRSGRGPVRRYVVEVERGIAINRQRFARRVHEILADRRSWGGTGRVSFRRVDRSPIHFRVTLATRGTTDRLCYPLITGGIFSCAQGGRAVLNRWRWRTGAAAFGRDLRRYRTYMVNHEVGHLLGHSHRGCPRAGVRAPVMMQQTKGVGSCRANGWPRAFERN